MNFIVVTNEWLSARGIITLPTMRKSKDGSRIILHEDYFNLIAPRDEEGNIELGDATVYAHNSAELNDLLSSEEWSYSDAEAPTESADYIQVAAVKNLMAVTKSGINTMALTDAEALKVKDVYPEWKAGIKVNEGERYQYDGLLYKCRKAHTTQAGWEPSIDTASMWEEVSETHSGTQDDPIPYNNNMALEEGKYYVQNGLTYKCTRSTEVPVYANLKDLVGIYVEKA